MKLKFDGQRETKSTECSKWRPNPDIWVSCKWLLTRGGRVSPPALTSLPTITAPQHLVCIAVQSLHINHMQTGIIEVFICRRLHMNTSTILICIWLVCRLCTALHTKCCGAVYFTYSGAYLTFPQFRFALRARLNLLPTRTVQARCGKVIPDTRCRHCHLVPETLSHLVNHCLHSMGQIRERHNTVLERLIRAIPPPPPPSMGDKYKEQPVPNTTGANCTRRSFRCHSGCLPCMTLLRRRYVNKNHCDNPSIGSIVWRCSIRRQKSEELVSPQ